MDWDGGGDGGDCYAFACLLFAGKIDVLPHGIVSAFFFSYRI